MNSASITIGPTPLRSSNTLPWSSRILCPNSWAYALRLPKPVLDGLRQAAEAHNVRVSALMRAWLEQRLATDTAGQDKVVSVDDLLALVSEGGHPAGGHGAA